METFSLVGCTGCIFDCDGTLLDTIPAWDELEKKIVAAIGRAFTPAEYEELHSAPHDECARIFHERFGLGESVQEVAQMMDDALLDFYRDQAEALPGVRALLERCRTAGIPCVVVTSSPQRYVSAGLAHAGLTGYFQRVITTDDAGCSKREDRIWQLALAEMGSDAATTWGFEDSEYAIKAMSRLGIRTVGAYDSDEAGTFEELSEAADLAVHSLEELL